MSGAAATIRVGWALSVDDGTGANDVVVVRGERERLLPFVKGDVIRKIDLQHGVMEVDWDPDF